MRSLKKILSGGSPKGFGLIEIIVGSAILTISLIAISTYFQKSLQLSQDSAKMTQASFLLEEGIEIAKFFRDASWLNISGLTAGAPYYLQFDGTKWATTSSNVFVDNVFERKLVIDNVSRDGSDEIVSSGGTNDPNTKKATVSVSWFEKNGTTTKSISTYLTNIF
ncbi:MAG: hypothetical protein KGJ58_00875 [Patescibacteria group bacterium]|nr:hypothetical protein [Patescibacteria group bacterium]MDE1988146.1 hypothetical protein [Patescibacteria group bacterium]MDE2217994.1 hypothetical protein [Patescibacteria group bacterium]